MGALNFYNWRKKNNHLAEALLTQDSETVYSKTVKNETNVKVAKIVLLEEKGKKKTFPASTKSYFNSASK